MDVGGPGVDIGELGPKDLIGRETGGLSGPREDLRKGPFKVILGQRIRGFRNMFLGIHNSLSIIPFIVP